MNPASNPAGARWRTWLAFYRGTGRSGGWRSYLGLAQGLVVMILLFGALSNHFLSLETFRTIANELPTLTVMSVGMTYVLIIAGIDLSVGSVLALTGSVLSLAMVHWSWGLGAATLLSMLAGAACGLATGTISVAWALPSFIVSLGMLEVARGAAYVVTNSRTEYIGSAVDVISAPLVFGISPAFIAAVAIVIVGQIVLTRTVFGRYMIGIGTNEEAMRLAGINPKPTQIAVFVLCGLLSAVGALFQVSRLEAADPNAGDGLELQVIAAVVIGGTSLMGGRGSVINTFFGVLIISVLQSGLAQIGASEPTKRVITGAVIIVAVVLDVYRSRKAARSAN